jgi:hypothetical protein
MTWALDALKPFKSEGTDTIAKELLQQRMRRLVPHLCRILEVWLACRYIPVALGRLEWRLYQSLGNLITLRKRLILQSACCLSFWRWWRSQLLRIHVSNVKRYPRHRNQYAYQSGKTTETALHIEATSIVKHFFTHGEILTEPYLT